MPIGLTDSDIVQIRIAVVHCCVPKLFPMVSLAPFPGCARRIMRSLDVARQFSRRDPATIMTCKASVALLLILSVIPHVNEPTVRVTSRHAVTSGITHRTLPPRRHHVIDGARSMTVSAPCSNPVSCRLLQG